MLEKFGAEQLLPNGENGSRLARAWRSVEEQMRQIGSLEGFLECVDNLVLMRHVLHTVRSTARPLYTVYVNIAKIALHGFIPCTGTVYIYTYYFSTQGMTPLGLLGPSGDDDDDDVSVLLIREQSINQAINERMLCCVG